MPFIKLAATEIVSGVSGESEEKVRELFSRAVVIIVNQIKSELKLRYLSLWHL